MADGTNSTSEAGPMPTPEQFIRFLVEHRGDVNEAGHAARRLVQIYAATWASVMGARPGAVIRDAEELFDETTRGVEAGEPDFDDGLKGDVARGY